MDPSSRSSGRSGSSTKCSVDGASYRSLLRGFIHKANLVSNGYSVSDVSRRDSLSSARHSVSNISGSSIAASRCQDPPSSARESRSSRESFSVLNDDADEEDRASTATIDWDRRASANRKLQKRSSAWKGGTEQVYERVLGLRAVPVPTFLGGTASNVWPLSITSMDEHRLLKSLGVARDERNHIQGLGGALHRTAQGENSEAMMAIARLARDPPPIVGTVQRLCTKSFLRVYPHGGRFSGRNMSPLPGWLAGSQGVCLNMSNIDLAVCLHFALFNRSGGFVLKPPEMTSLGDVATSRRFSDIMYWPPAREMLHCATVRVNSLFGLPKRGEQRPRFDGHRAECHSFVTELSGAHAPPHEASDLSQPGLVVSLHAIGGFCAISDVLPLSYRTSETKVTVPAVKRSIGGNAHFRSKLHCIAAEPGETFLRVGVVDGGKEVAYESVVLARLRPGHRVLQLRSLLGSRIELAYIFVTISIKSEVNIFATARQLRLRIGELETQHSRDTAFSGRKSLDGDGL